MTYSGFINYYRRKQKLGKKMNKNKDYHVRCYNCKSVNYIYELDKELQKAKQEVFDDLLNNIDNIRPKIDLVKGINNKSGYVEKQALFDYLEKKQLFDYLEKKHQNEKEKM